MLLIPNLPCMLISLVRFIKKKKKLDVTLQNNDKIKEVVTQIFFCHILTVLVMLVLSIRLEK